MIKKYESGLSDVVMFRGVLYELPTAGDLLFLDKGFPCEQVAMLIPILGSDPCQPRDYFSEF